MNHNITIHCNERELAHALSASRSSECIAFLLGERDDNEYHITEIIPTDNVTSRDPYNSYAIGKNAWIQIRKYAKGNNLQILGHAHSHIAYYANSEPSSQDYRYLKNKVELGAVYLPSKRLLQWYNKSGKIGHPKFILSAVIARVRHALRVV